jgi:hypothetical protein
MRATIIAVFVIAFSANQAFAVSHAVKMACKDDYFAHCSMHSPGGPEVRQCMRAVGPRLSQRCLGALADAGEIPKSKAASKTTRHAKKQLAANKLSAKKTFANTANGKKKLAKAKVGKKQFAKAAAPYPTKASAARRADRDRYTKQKLARKYALARG